MPSHGAVPDKGGIPAVPRMDYRRSPPATSKSLPRHKRQKLAHGEGDGEAVVSPALLLQQTSSGSGTAESAGKWFDSVNKNVATGQRTSLQTSGQYASHYY